MNRDTAEVREKAIRLFTYLKELTQLRTAMVRDLSAYESVLWFDDVPREPGCFTVAWGAQREETEAWLEVERHDEPRVPAVPKICQPWVDSSQLQRSDAEPRLRERIPAPTEPPVAGRRQSEEERPQFLELADRPNVQAQWAKYVEDDWKPWAEMHRWWSKIQQVYGRLFTIYQQQKRLGEAYELVLGLGLLSWTTPSGQRVRRHLLVGQANLSFDANRGTMSVQAASDGVKLTLETDMLEPAERPPVEQQLAVEAAVQLATESPWEKPTVEHIIRSWAHALDSRAEYRDGLQPPPDVSCEPTVVFAPALILRKRSSRNLIRLVDEIIRNISAGGAVPIGIQRLCEIVDDRETSPCEAGCDNPEPADVDDEVYFPLPANEEQRQIVERLRNAQGVVVQGPPGTGKSHTIANLICHLLANGQRVLVASQTPRALKVLKDRIPEQLSALAVSLLGNDAFALQDLEDSVLGITERHYAWNSVRNAQQVKELESDLAEFRRQIANIERLLRELREKESYEHRIADGAYSGTTVSISKRVAQEAAQHGWFPDQIREDTKIPFNAEAFGRLLHAYRHLTPGRLAELRHLVIARERLPDTNVVLQMIAAEQRAQELCHKHAARVERTTFRALSRARDGERRALTSALLELRSALGALRRRPFDWLDKAVSDILSGRARAWQELSEAAAVNLDGLIDRARAAQARTVVCPSEHLQERDKLRQNAFDLWTHLNNGGGLGWWLFRAEPVKRALFLTKVVRVNGRVCDTIEVLAELMEHLDFETQLDRLWGLWEGVVQSVEGPYARQVAHLQEFLEALNLALGLNTPVAAVNDALERVGLPVAVRQEDDAIDEILTDLEAVDAAENLVRARSAFESTIEELHKLAIRGSSHSANQHAIALLESRAVEGWDSILEEVESLESDKSLLSERDRLASALSSTAPSFAAALARNSKDENWEPRLREVESTWAWARADAWLRSWDEERSAERLEPERLRLTERVRASMAELAAHRAWRHLFENRLKEEHRQHLMAWTQAVKRIGKGTGKYAEKHRRDAQAYMNACRDAIPAWIMPFYRVAESLSAAPEAFDVVIVDEASQSGPETLILLYLAKKCIIVGDDQQISPDAVGVDRADVDLLIERHLAGLPFNESFGVESSLFNQAIIRFGGRIVLREHFRCMPEIIRFSNDLCYAATPLLPLRQYPPQRLEPIIVQHVADGFREGASQSARNVSEADALVDAVCRCCADPIYAGKTFGVISLQGEYQARLIERKLIERLEPEQIENRGLVCGDAYAFQGDERDVIFLTLVAAPNERIGALTKDADKRRFNVAASRARDQLWLFHTATLNDLHPGDMRHKLLAYCLNPGTSITGDPEWNRCESDLEREVGRQIYARQYRLLLQFEPFGPGGKRIDLVVEGLRARLAVECDGDRWHGPEKYDEDMARQRQLERCGWEFWRVRGSTFYRDPVKALEPLWKRLSKLGISPTCRSVMEVTAPVSLAHRSHQVESVCLPGGLLFTKDVPAANARNTDDVHDMEIGAAAVACVAVNGPITEDVAAANVRDTDDLHDVEIGAALLAYVLDKGPITREKLFIEAARSFGYSNVGRKLRSRLNKALNSLDHAGRVRTDWTNVWLPS